jgi:hypothetical protein
VSGHDAVARILLARHPEVAAAMDDERVELAEGPRVAEQLDPLVRGELARVVLPLDPLDAAPEARLVLAAAQLVER